MDLSAKFPTKEIFRLYRGPKWCKARMYSFPNPFSANIRLSNEKSERFKVKGNTVEYDGKIGRSGLCG